MSLEENKAIIRRLVEAVYKQNLVVVDELLAPDFVEHSFQLKGLESMKQTVTMLFKGFPDLHVTIEDIAAEGNKVWDRVTATGTHTGEYRGIAPTGKKITFTGVRIWRIIDGKVVERTSVFDFIDLFKKLGIIEYTEQGKELFLKDVS
ncbi:MAG: ester cyclase [Candidatus Bathyarchaeota archaeon]|nr:MAG: ester cyclase [Candidatus Bathyarchaeota archaeon]